MKWAWTVTIRWKKFAKWYRKQLVSSNASSYTLLKVDLCSLRSQARVRQAWSWTNKQSANVACSFFNAEPFALASDTKLSRLLNRLLMNIEPTRFWDYERSALTIDLNPVSSNLWDRIRRQDVGPCLTSFQQIYATYCESRRHKMTGVVVTRRFSVTVLKTAFTIRYRRISWKFNS